MEGARRRWSNNVASTGQRWLPPVLRSLLSSPASEGLAGRGSGARLPTGSGASPTDQQFTQRPSAWGPPDQQWEVKGGRGGRCCPGFVPRLSQDLAGCPGALPRTWYFPLPWVADSLDSSVLSHTTGLAPGSQWLSGQPSPDLCSNNKCGTKKQERKKKEGKWKGRMEGTPVSMVFKMSIFFSSVF